MAFAARLSRFPMQRWMKRQVPQAAGSSGYQIPYTVEVMNRFKGLDLVGRMPGELWMGLHNIVQETVTKIIWKK